MDSLDQESLQPMPASVQYIQAIKQQKGAQSVKKGSVLNVWLKTKKSEFGKREAAENRLSRKILES